MLKHLTKNMIAGVVVLLPIGGTLLTVGYLEMMISDSGLAKLPYYFPGLGLLLAALLIYFLGVITTTVVGRWLWRLVDRVLMRVPAAGRFYVTLKQILGYGDGEEAVFHEVVWVPSSAGVGEELALVTERMQTTDGRELLTLFLPGAPNPTAGRMIVVDRKQVRSATIEVHDALKALVTVGKSGPLNP